MLLFALMRAGSLIQSLILRLVHDVADTVGLDHTSVGEDPNRYIVVAHEGETLINALTLINR